MLKNEDFIQEFVEEARDHLDNFERIFVCDLAAIDAEQINDAFRAIHSIKGTAGFFGLVQIVSIAHAMETILDFVNRQKVTLGDAEIDLLLEARDRLSALVNDVKHSDSYPIDDILARLELAAADFAQQAGHQAAPVALELPPQNQFFAVFAFDQALPAQIAALKKTGHHIYGLEMALTADYLSHSGGSGAIADNLTSVAKVLTMISPGGEVLNDAALKAGQYNHQLILILAASILEASLFIQVLGLPASSVHLLAEDWQAVIASPAPAADYAGSAGDTTASGCSPAEAHEGAESLRINIRLLDDLMNMASELVLARNRLLTLLEPEKKRIPGLPPVLANVDRLTSSLQEKIMLTRMQPVATLFNRYPRLIRELSKTLDKKLELKIAGGEVELDKSILEGLSDPLVHLLRNAADHGIESAAQRQQQGKSETATITLKASYEGSVVNIEIGDDGSGLDFARIAAIARAKKLYPENDLNHFSEKELINVLFNPGFSTADHLSEVSGRGVGLDVVRTNLDKLGGSIDISTQPGRGTTVKLSMPLTVSIIQSLVVAADGHKMVIPQADVQETIKLKNAAGDVPIEAINGKYFYRLRNELLPVVYLSDLWHPDPAGRVAHDHKIVVLKLGSLRFGVLVEVLIGNEETLIKPLPAILKGCGIYSGLTIMGDGRVAPILDIAGIARKMALDSDSEAPGPQNLREEHVAAADERTDFVLFRASGPEILALDIAQIKRIEKIKKAHWRPLARAPT